MLFRIKRTKFDVNGTPPWPLATPVRWFDWLSDDGTLVPVEWEANLSLDELRLLQAQNKHRLVIDFEDDGESYLEPYKLAPMPLIEIYNGYRE